MAFTKSDDVNILQQADFFTVGAGLGDDIYLLTPHTFYRGEDFERNPETKTIMISDPLHTEGGHNSLQLLEGMWIQSSVVTPTTLLLTLDNDPDGDGPVGGTEIIVLGADRFIYEPGANIVEGIAHEGMDYATFVSKILGVQLPTQGFAEGDSVVILPVASDRVEVTLPVGEGSKTTQATASAELFSLNLGEEGGAYQIPDNTQITLEGFDPAKDALRLDFETPISGIQHLSDLDGKEIDGRTISVQPDEIHKSTVIDLGFDFDGDRVILNLMGIEQSSLVNVTVI